MNDVWHGLPAHVFKEKKYSGLLAHATKNPMAKQRKTDNQTQAQADKINKRVKDRDKLTMGKIVTLADDVSKSAFKGGDIAVAIPARTRSNTLWNKKRGILQMGDGKASREL